MNVPQWAMVLVAGILTAVGMGMGAGIAELTMSLWMPLLTH